jgi:hypothetical protein
LIWVVVELKISVVTEEVITSTTMVEVEIVVVNVVEGRVIMLVWMVMVVEVAEIVNTTVDTEGTNTVVWLVVVLVTVIVVWVVESSKIIRDLVIVEVVKTA